MIDTLAPHSGAAQGLAPEQALADAALVAEVRHGVAERGAARKARWTSGYGVALEKLARGEPLPPELVEFHLFRNFMAAQERYQPEPYEGDMVLFKASEADNQYLGAGDTPSAGRSTSAATVRVTGIRGSHFSMMAEPRHFGTGRGLPP